MDRQALITAANRSGAVILPDAKGWKNRLQIRSSSSNNLYVVAQRETSGEWGCSCRGWIRHRHCKHLTAMTPYLISAPAAAKPAAALPAPAAALPAPAAALPAPKTR
jgi:hypothetical protein